MRHFKKYPVCFPASVNYNPLLARSYMPVEYNPIGHGNSAISVDFRRCQRHCRYHATGKKRMP